MTVVGSRSRRAVLAAAIAAVTGIAVAQARVPARIDGIWNWRHHEPVPSRVHRAERADRITAPPAQRQATTHEVESLYRNLMRGEGAPSR